MPKVVMTLHGPIHIQYGARHIESVTLNTIFNVVLRAFQIITILLMQAINY